MSNSYSLYVSAEETGKLFSVLVQFPTDTISRTLDAMNKTVGAIVERAYEDKPKLLSFLSPAQKIILNARIHFWKAIDDRVSQSGCFPPLKPFKHAAQSYNLRQKVELMEQVSREPYLGEPYRGLLHLILSRNKKLFPRCGRPLLLIRSSVTECSKGTIFWTRMKLPSLTTRIEKV